MNLAFYCLLFTAVGAGFILVHLLAGKLVRPNKPGAEKKTVYECGEPTIGSAWIQFDLRFYVVALLFVIFDVEVAFFFPWAEVFGRANDVAHLNRPTDAASYRDYCQKALAFATGRPEEPGARAAYQKIVNLDDAGRGFLDAILIVDQQLGRPTDAAGYRAYCQRALLLPSAQQLQPEVREAYDRLAHLDEQGLEKLDKGADAALTDARNVVKQHFLAPTDAASYRDYAQKASAGASGLPAPTATTQGAYDRLAHMNDPGQVDALLAVRRVVDLDLNATGEDGNSIQQARTFAWYAFLDILVFFGVLLVGFAYLWRRGDLAWVRSIAAERAPPPGPPPGPPPAPAPPPEKERVLTAAGGH
jgi:NADH:ubiquinone oxidoreductase subunit 3 (subunit A)